MIPPFPKSNNLVHLKVNVFESFLSSVFSFPILSSLGMGSKRYLVFLGRVGNAQALFL